MVQLGLIEFSQPTIIAVIALVGWNCKLDSIWDTQAVPPLQLVHLALGRCLPAASAPRLRRPTMPWVLDQLAFGLFTIYGLLHWDKRLALLDLH